MSEFNINSNLLNILGRAVGRVEQVQWDGFYYSDLMCDVQSIDKMKEGDIAFIFVRPVGTTFCLSGHDLIDHYTENAHIYGHKALLKVVKGAIDLDTKVEHVMALDQ